MSYQKQNFANGEVLTASQLNHIENGIVDVESAVNATKTVVNNIIDPTLSLSGKAADAAKVGEAVNAESERAKGVESQLKEYIINYTAPLEVSFNRTSHNMVDSSAVNGVPFSSVFTSSSKVYFYVPPYTFVSSRFGQITGVVQFTDNTIATLGSWYAENDNEVIVSGGINQTKALDAAKIKTITKMGVLFGSSARNEYKDKTIKNIGLYDHLISTDFITDDFNGKFISNKLNEIESEINAITAEWFIENTYYVATGIELNIYFDTILKTNANYYIKCNTTADNSFFDLLDNGIRFKTNSVVGSYKCTLTAYIKGSNTLLSSAAFNVKVVENNKLPKKIMFIGDSLTAQNYFVESVKNDSDGKIELYGTLGNTGYKHEGRSGWRPSDYLYKQEYNENSNAFYNPNKEGSAKFDFNYYMQNNPAFSDVEIVNILLGRNGGYDNANLVDHLQFIADSVKAFNSNIKVYVCLPYFTPWENEEYFSVRNISANETNKASFIGYKAIKTGMKNVNFVPIGVNIDTKYDYPRASRNVSYRNSGSTKMVYLDCVHPNTYGYAKMGDVWYSYMLGLIT